MSGTRGPGTGTRPGLETSSGTGSRPSPEAEGETGGEAEDEAGGAGAGPGNVVRITAVGDGWAISCWIRRSRGSE